MKNPWVIGARPKTLVAAVVPVLVGTRLAVGEGQFQWWAAALSLLVALSLQIGVNYANDYSDGVRGADSHRVGPTRLVASGLMSADSVKWAAFFCFGIAALAGLVLSIFTHPWLLVLGVAAISAAWFYTGGERPYGYRGFGEVFVFVFFGPVAVLGTLYVQAGYVTAAAVFASISVGLLAVALLVVNNLRDRRSDEEAGKRTLAVRLGDLRTRRLYLACATLPFVVNFATLWFHPGAVLGFLAAFFLIGAAKPIQRRATGVDLIGVLTRTARLHLAFGVLLAVGLGF